MKYIVSYIVIVVMLLIVTTSMPSIQVLGQQENTPMPTCPENSWRFDEGGECTTCEAGWWSALGCFWTPSPQPVQPTQECGPYPGPELTPMLTIDPYPAPIDDNGDEIETVTHIYIPTCTPTPVWIDAEYCIKLVTHSICRR